MKRTLTTLVLATSGTLTVAGCSDLVESPVALPEAASTDDLPALAPPTILLGLTADDLPGESAFRQMAAVDSSFAGFFFEGDKGDELVALSTTGSLSLQGQSLLEGLALGAGDPGASSVSVRRATYSFLQLSAWRELLGPTIWESDDVAALDLDEFNNRLTVFLVEGTGEETIRTAAQRLGVPDAALGFEVSGETVTANARQQTLRDRMRPVRGGIQIGHSGCTYGFNALFNGETVMVMNSHCTSGMFRMDGDLIYQPFNSWSQIGQEISDPNWYNCGVWPSSRRCRKSDSAVVRLSLPSADIGLYQIARTQWRRYGIGGRGSIYIDQENPYFTVGYEITNISKGKYFNKIGQQTGWTYGKVLSTCTVEVVWKNGVKYHITCAYRMNARTEYGDSGSPVFEWNGASNNVGLTGLVFGMTDVRTEEVEYGKAVFNSVNSIKLDHGYMQTAPNRPDPGR